MSIAVRSRWCTSSCPTLAELDDIGEPCCAQALPRQPHTTRWFSNPGGESMTRCSHAPPRRSRLATLVSPLVLLCFATTLHAQAAPQTGTIVGVVLEQATGQPLEASAVLVVGTKLAAGTDRRGHFIIRGVPAGAVNVR